MIYSAVVTGGVLRLRHPGRCLPSRLICINSIPVSTMSHATNEAPRGQESVQLTVTLFFFILHRKDQSLHIQCTPLVFGNTQYSFNDTECVRYDFYTKSCACPKCHYVDVLIHSLPSIFLHFPYKEPHR